MKDEITPGKQRKIAAYLLKIKAVQISIDPPFIWSSGKASPIYCDNRLTLSYPEVRKEIQAGFVEIIQRQFPHIQGVAGVATGGIAHAALVADSLNLPMVYIRGKAKAHGKKNQVEGKVEPGASYLVIEDLVSTGKSSLAAVQALQDAGGVVACTLAIFSYGLPLADKAYEAIGQSYQSLTQLSDLMEVAVELNLLEPQEQKIVDKWQNNPDFWQ
ncbi:MAG: orotate phosphoribosyltransferase [Bacteroidota bacterium]